MRTSNRRYWITLALLTVVSFLAFAYPLYVIRPFRAQGARELAVALAVRSWGPLLAIFCAVSVLVLAVALWRRSPRRLARIAMVPVVAIAIGFAALSRVNVYELMFHRLDAAEFTTPESAKVDADDMVLEVTLGNSSHAYPIRIMAYHHIANDEIGGVPIAATY